MFRQEIYLAQRRRGAEESLDSARCFTVKTNAGGGLKLIHSSSLGLTRWDGRG